MPKASKKSVWEEVKEDQAQGSNQPDTNESSQEDIPSSDQESDTEVIINPPEHNCKWYQACLCHI